MTSSKISLVVEADNEEEGNALDHEVHQGLDTRKLARSFPGCQGTNSPRNREVKQDCNHARRCGDRTLRLHPFGPA